MSRVEVKSSSGGGFASLLTVAFIVLKLCHVISWSWVWVLAPLWLGAAFTLVILLVMLVIAVLVS